jgi:uncharacterized protein (DUF362 family)
MRISAGQRISGAQLDLVKQMVRDIAAQTMGGMRNIVKPGDKVLIKSIP